SGLRPLGSCLSYRTSCSTKSRIRVSTSVMPDCSLIVIIDAICELIGAVFSVIFSENTPKQAIDLLFCFKLAHFENRQPNQSNAGFACGKERIWIGKTTERLALSCPQLASHTASSRARTLIGA